VSFTNPPVVEVVAGVTFDGLTAETSALLGSFWKEELRSAFPSLQLQPPYTIPDEPQPANVHALSIMLPVGLPAPRLWALSGDGQELLQLQPGWFACNWRKVQPEGEYDRWMSRRSAFRAYFAKLTDYLSREGSGEPKVRQCEVTYINHIMPSPSWSSHADFSEVFSLQLMTAKPYRPEQVTLQTQFGLEHEGEFYGRLHVKVLPAFGLDGHSPIYVLELTARGAPIGDGVDGALTFLDRGRAAIDRAFVMLTTEKMHAEWGLQND